MPELPIDTVLDVSRQLRGEDHPPVKVHVVRDNAVLPQGLKAPGPVVIGRGVKIQGPVDARGYVHIGAGAAVAGDVHAMGEVVVGAGVAIAGGLTAEGRVLLMGNTLVAGPIDSAGDMTIHHGARCDTVRCGGDLFVHGPAATGDLDVRGRIFSRSV